MPPVAVRIALRDPHAVDVVRHGLAAHEDDGLALFRPLDRIVGREDRVTRRGARRGRQPLGGDGKLLPLLRIESGREQLRQRLRIDEEDRLLRRDQPFLHEIGGDDDGGVAGALAAARLQHEQTIVLDRELEVLHVR